MTRVPLIRHAHLNGHLVPEDRALVSILDRGLLFGDGVFETMRTYRGRVFRLSQHLNRLEQSMTAIGMSGCPTESDVRQWIADLCEAEGLEEARLRLTVTGGAFDGQIRLRRSGSPSLVLMALPLTTPTAADYENGIELGLSPVRQSWSSPLARIKTTHRLEYLMAREEALGRGYQDGLLLDDRGGLCESTSSNIFLVREGRLVTPSLDSPILPGVTRDAVIEAAGRAGVTTEERFVPAEELWQAVELFATATSWEVLPIRAVEGRRVGAGGRGPVTARVHEAFRELVAAETGA